MTQSDSALSDQRRFRDGVRQVLLSAQMAGLDYIYKPPPAATAVGTGELMVSEAATSLRDLPDPVPTQVEHMNKPTKSGSDTSDVNRIQQLSVLQQEVCDCRRCPELVAERSQTVFGVGSPHARVCFLGEAPGADEDRLGEPFVGRAGQLLDKILSACTLAREDVYILNVLKCRPPKNRTPGLEEVENCRPYFERQLQLIQPEFICCLGAVAASSLLRTKSALGKLRGEFHDWRGIQVLVTYHPAYLLRNPPMKAETWKDMQMLMKALGIPLKSSST